MIVLDDGSVSLLQRGIAALFDALGQDASLSLLQRVKEQPGEVASFTFPLPPDYTGLERSLHIGFPSNFPRHPMSLKVVPTPWLVWPHAMESGLCLYGFKERLITGSPEVVVRDSFARLKKIVSLSQLGSDNGIREIEFQNEITSYWSRQLEKSSQTLILLDRPQSASTLAALSDRRESVPSGKETLWLATDGAKIQKHFRRIAGKDVKMRALALPGFYLKLQSFPKTRMPAPKDLLAWLTPHVHEQDAIHLLQWFRQQNSIPNKWIVLELPGESGAPIFCLNVRAGGLLQDRGQKFGLRASRRRGDHAQSTTPSVIQSSTINILDRTETLSRDLSGAPKSLINSRIVVVGVGSLGGVVATLLARSGIGHMTLIDPDTLVSANLGRHVLGIDDLGKPKVFALRDKIHNELPFVEVLAQWNYAEKLINSKPEIFEKADLVIVTTADWESEVALWRTKANSAPWGLVQAWSEPHTHVGHILFAPKGKFDASYLFEDNGDFKFKYTIWPQGGVVPLPACGESFIPGGHLGLSSIANMIAQTSVRALLGSLESSAWITYISAPQDVETLGGTYQGPLLPTGVQNTVLERAWPEGK